MRPASSVVAEAAAPVIPTDVFRARQERVRRSLREPILVYGSQCSGHARTTGSGPELLTRVPRELYEI